MEWQAAMTAARDWAAQSSLGFSVGTVVENERKISFKAPWGSFYVTIPEKIGSEEWVTQISVRIKNKLRRCPMDVSLEIIVFV